MSELHWMTPGREHVNGANDLEARALGYAYKADDPVLTDVTAHIVPGSFLAILGMNGCGKSTLLACLDDMLRPNWGKVMFAQRELSTYSREERARHIALVAQHSHANGVTVYDALLLGRKPYVKAAPSADDYAVIDRVIDELDLEHLALRYLDELSGGEYQKVVIARALVQDTDVLLLDEPTNNLDMANQVEVMELVRHIAREHGMACAAVLHDINLALRYCDRFLVIKDGEVLAYGGLEVMTQNLIEKAYNTRVEIIEHTSTLNDGTEAKTTRLVVPLAQQKAPYKQHSPSTSSTCSTPPTPSTCSTFSTFSPPSTPSPPSHDKENMV